MSARRLRASRACCPATGRRRSLCPSHARPASARRAARAATRRHTHTHTHTHTHLPPMLFLAPSCLVVVRIHGECSAHHLHAARTWPPPPRAACPHVRCRCGLILWNAPQNLAADKHNEQNSRAQVLRAALRGRDPNDPQGPSTHQPPTLAVVCGSGCLAVPFEAHSSVRCSQWPYGYVRCLSARLLRTRRRRRRPRRPARCAHPRAASLLSCVALAGWPSQSSVHSTDGLCSMCSLVAGCLHSFAIFDHSAARPSPTALLLRTSNATQWWCCLVEWAPGCIGHSQVDV